MYLLKFSCQPLNSMRTYTHVAGMTTQPLSKKKSNSSAYLHTPSLRCATSTSGLCSTTLLNRFSGSFISSTKWWRGHVLQYRLFHLWASHWLHPQRKRLRRVLPHGTLATFYSQLVAGSAWGTLPWSLLRRQYPKLVSVQLDQQGPSG